MCLNKRVIAGLAVAALAVLTIAPRAFASVGPLLLFAACPLSMLFMMRSMSGSGKRTCDTTAATSDQAVSGTKDDVVAATRSTDAAERRELEEEVARLKAELYLREERSSS